MVPPVQCRSCAIPVLDETGSRLEKLLPGLECKPIRPMIAGQCASASYGVRSTVGANPVGGNTVGGHTVGGDIGASSACTLSLSDASVNGFCK